MASRSSFAAQAARPRARKVKVFDFEAPENNDWLAVNQFTVGSGYSAHRLAWPSEFSGTIPKPCPAGITG